MKEERLFIHKSAQHDKVDTFRVVQDISEVPLAYQIWNIGRENFPLIGYLPFVRVFEDYTIDPNTLIACPMPSEAICLRLFKMSMRNELGGSTAENVKKKLDKMKKAMV